jgi:molybdate transport system substrate-binding protein
VRRISWWFVLTAVVLLAAVGCGQQTEVGTGPEGGGGDAGDVQTIEAMVPCGQAGPFTKVAALFEAENPGVTVRWVPTNMVVIVGKIRDGERPDVVLSMGDVELDQLEAEGLLEDGTRAAFAENALSIVVPKGNPGGVAALADLAKPSVKTVTIPDPELNSVGRHAKEALEKAGIWDEVSGKTIFTPQAAQSKEATASGQADASVGYYPCSFEVHTKGQELSKPEKFELVGMVPADLHEAFWCEGAVLKDARNPEGAKKLLAFLHTPEAHDIFRQWQFVHDLADAPQI